MSKPMKPEPTYVDGVPMCSVTCQHCYIADHGSVCEISRREDVLEGICEPAVRNYGNLVAQVAEVKRLCKSHSNPGSNPGAHKLAGDVLRILEDGE